MTVDDRRLEELGLNSSAPPGQLLYDGWVVRLLPGKAKRARSVNAVYPSSVPLDAKIAHCERLFRAASLPTLFRITPFSHPDHRRSGHARRLVDSLLAAAAELGAHTAYLQVERGNVGARRLYAAFGFRERYLYWYRARDPESA